VHKVVLDTTVWISARGTRKSAPARQQRARRVLSFLTSQPTRFSVYYSERLELELAHDAILPTLKHFFHRLPYHVLNETWDQSEGKWENCGSRWDDVEESRFGEAAEILLPDRVKSSNRRDRGIYGDAVFAKCRCLLHENPRDFDRCVEDSERHGLKIINLLNHEANEVEEMRARLSPSV
jgi:hypothetical protein